MSDDGEQGVTNRGISLLQNEMECYNSAKFELSQVNGDVCQTDANYSCAETTGSDTGGNESPSSLHRRGSDTQSPSGRHSNSNEILSDSSDNAGGTQSIANSLPNNIAEVKIDADVGFGLAAFTKNMLHVAEGCNSMNAKRLVTKEGMVDIKYVNMPGIKSRFMRDLFHTLMDAKWRYNCLLFTLSFLISWVFFGTIWFIIIHFRTTNCVDNVNSWTTAFLFSIETQTTIGYGGRAVTSECPEGIILLAVQTIIGMFIQCFMLGLMFGKLARPKNRGKTTMFSKNAVITVRDENFCLVFRYADLCRRILLDSNMRMVMIRSRETLEGEFLPLDMADLELTIDYEQVEYTMRLFPLFPVTVIHIINEDSPLYGISRADLETVKFEIIAILEGTVPTTGNTTQALSSYRPDEIRWGHRFKPVSLGVGQEMRMNSIDLMTIHDTYEENITPDCSAEDYENMKDEEDEEDGDGSSSSSSSSSCSESNGDDHSADPCDINTDVISCHDCVGIDSDTIRDIFTLKETEA